MATRPRTSTIDRSALKGRIAEAFVEAIFRRAGYRVTRVGRESQIQRLIKVGSDEFLPDFLIRKSLAREAGQRPLHKLIPVEVKYRRDVDGFLRAYGQDLFEKVGPAWPELYIVFVTDNPAPGRSSFQVLDLCGGWTSATRDLHVVAHLDIYESTVREYEGLVGEMFALLGRRIPAGARIASEA